MNLTQTLITPIDRAYSQHALYLQRSPHSFTPQSSCPLYMELCAADKALSPPNFCTNDSNNNSYLSTGPNSDSEDVKKYEMSAKYKTEMCKNFQLTGKCKFGARCCFAHGSIELREKTTIGKSYKLKVCKNFQELGYCKYGQRCQYVHLKEGELFSDILQTLQNKVAKSISDKKDERLENILKQSSSLSNGLPIFQSILRRAGANF